MSSTASTRLKSSRRLTEGASGARLGTVVGWKTPAGQEYGVVLGQDEKFLICLSLYEKSLVKDKGLRQYRDTELSDKLVMRGGVPGFLADVQRVPAGRATKMDRVTGKALQVYVKAAAQLKLENIMDREHGDRLIEALRSLRDLFGPVLSDPDAPWDGSLREWQDFFFLKFEGDPLVEVELSTLDELTEEELSERGSLHWVRQKFGGAAAAAHRNFLKMVRKNPAAHKRKMRSDKIYRRRHKFHDALMRRTARKGKRRVRSEDVQVLERDAGQTFMDLPFELRVTEKKGAKSALTDKQRSELAKAASDKAGMKVPKHYLKECSMEAFYANTQYFYRVKGAEWEGSKEEKLNRAIAASYSTLKRSCGVDSKENMTPSEIVAQGGGKLGPRGEKS